MSQIEWNRSCADCRAHNCDSPDGDRPGFCVAKKTPKEIYSFALKQYNNDPEDSRIFLAAAEVEGLYSGRLTRIEEIIVFAQRIGAKKIGIASCMCLMSESEKFVEILKAKGISSVIAINCKVGGIDKTCAGIPEDMKKNPGFHESLCNPIVQAQVLNDIKTDLNVIVGLCVGHDSLFIKYSRAPITYLVVKDRILAHNPAAALYITETYYRRLLSPDLPICR